jgi:hypothetical protein
MNATTFKLNLAGSAGMQPAPGERRVPKESARWWPLALFTSGLKVFPEKNPPPARP